MPASKAPLWGLLILVPWLLGWFYVLSEEAYFAANPHLELAEVRERPELYRGEILLLAGRILTHETLEDGSRLKILCYEADGEGEPMTPDPECGRFVLRSERSLDSGGFEPGRLLTLAGTVTGNLSEDGTPELSAGEIHLWPDPEEEERYRSYRYPYPYAWPTCRRYPFGHDPFCDPFFDDFYHRHRF